MQSFKISRLDGWIAASLGIVALIVFKVTLAVGAYPGPFSSSLVQGMGLFPRLAPGQPLWFTLVGLVGKFPSGGDPAMPMHAFSALCGAAAVAMLYLVVRGVIVLQIRHDDEETTSAAYRAGRLAGLGAALALAFCMPFWIASTRCHWASFHVLLFLVAAHLFNRFAERGSRPLEWGWAFLFGLGVVEYATFIVFLPLYACLYLFVLHRRERLEASAWGPTAVFFVLGLSSYFLAAWQFIGSEGYGLRGHDSWFPVLWSFWRDQWFLLARSLPAQGWLVVLVVTALPAAVALMVARRALNDENDWTYLVLHLVLSALAVAVLINMPFAPWPMMGYQRLLLMPYVLLAAVFGYLLAFWWRLPSGWWRRSAGPVRQYLRKGFGPVVAALGLALTVIAAWRNAGPANGRSSILIREYAAEVVRSLDGRTWLVTDGVLDSALLVEAHRQGIPLRLLDMASENNPLMKHYVARQFEDVRMRNLAQLSFRTMLRSWLERDPAAAGQVALLVNPELWLGVGYQAMPQVALFLGVRDNVPESDAETIMRRHREAWDRLETFPYFADPHTGGSLELYRRYIRGQLSLVANNVGVLMEDLAHKDLAYEAYGRARRLDPGNLCALMNQYTMVENGHSAPDADAVRTTLMEAKESFAEHKPTLAALTQQYGTVRSKTAFASMSREWALAGSPELAASGVRRAMGLIPTVEQGPLKQALAGLYMMQNRDADSELLLAELLGEDPRNQAALLGMARVELSRGDRDTARSYLERATAAGVPAPLMRLEWATLHLAAGELDEALALLARVVADDPESLRAWAIIVAIHVKKQDPAGLYDAIRNIQRVKQGNAHLLAVASGYLSLLQDDLPGAAMAFEKALTLQPRDIVLLEWLIRIDILQGLTGRIHDRLRQLLKLDPANAFGNFVMAGLQSGSKDYDLAQDSLRQSLASRRTPEALNDLAWLLQESGLYAEAEEHVRSALELSPDLSPAWDTLGEILMKTERHAEARAAFEKALAGSSGSAIITLHLAELDLKQGRRQDASGRLDALTARQAELTTEERALLAALQQKL